MLDERLISVIEKLTVKSLKGLAYWNKTSREDSFSIYIGQGRILIERGVGVYTLTIYNDQGEAVAIENASFDDEVAFFIMNNLYSAASDSYYKVDDLYGKFLDELDSEGNVGLPF